MEYSADPDQFEANWSGSNMFAKAKYIRIQAGPGLTLLAW